MRICVAATLATVVASVAACSSSDSPSMAYQDVGKANLDESLLVVAASRQDISSSMKGATLLVGRDGKDISRLDNSGLDSVSIAHADGVVGFADVDHDYLLGTSRPVRSRDATPDTIYKSYLTDDGLVSLFNGGAGDDGYELVVVDPAARKSVRTEIGYVQASAQCESGIWASMSRAEDGMDQSPSANLRRISPGSSRTITLTSQAEVLELSEASCDGDTWAAVGSETDGDGRAYPVLAVADLASGKSEMRRITGLEEQENPEVGPTVWTAGFSDGRLYAVVSADPQVHERTLVRIDTKTGNARIQAVVTSDDSVIDTLVRIEGEHLYLLDSTRGDDSQIRAFNLADGQGVGRRNLAPLDEKLNSQNTSFEDTLFVRDFAVTTPVEQW